VWGNKGQKQKPQKDTQLQQIVDKTIIYADQDGDGKISYEEFCAVSAFCIFFLSFSQFRIRLQVIWSKSLPLKCKK